MENKKRPKSDITTLQKQIKNILLKETIEINNGYGINMNRKDAERISLEIWKLIEISENS